MTQIIYLNRKQIRIPKWVLHQCLVFISDKEVIQEQFKLNPPSGAIPEDSLHVLCKVLLPEEDWEPQTTARVSMSSLLVCRGCPILEK